MSLEDKAQEHEAAEWAIRNRPRAVRTFNPGEDGYGPEECAECGDAMHPVRRGHGFKLCTSCQSAREIVNGRLVR